MHATAASQGKPVVLFVDVLHGVINSVFNKNFHVKVGFQVPTLVGRPTLVNASRPA